MQQPRLTLFPQQPLNKVIDLPQFLTETQLIGESFNFKQQTHYLVGKQFFQHIMFLGCSPFIKTELSDDLDDVNFCHIEIVPPQSELQFFQAQKARTPHCPYCKYKIQDWQSVIKQWQQDKASFAYTCPECGQTMQIEQLNWHSKAGFAHEMINIWGIFEGEAIPSYELLFQLKQWTGVNWQYCHATAQTD
ncbi:hypothetical protein [Candidatus Albibeggiatoa sp. nov. NOAA]|uniref:hypothetical protein n=1 Tax=Candidatus Albibeggiatoa sp. nov. NOAA TaxID=3162724 RepID=UPI0032F92ADE|nr:hypothetical protein [Thiotrichaceae bacterium]